MDPYKISSNTNMNTTSSQPRSVIHLDIFRTEVMNHLDAIASETNINKRDIMINNARKFVENYASAPAPTPREPPEQSQRCTAIRAGGQQCTRRRKENTTFCGTHVRYGQTACSGTNIEHSSTPTENNTSVGIARSLRAVVSSSGIPHFVDDNSNVWCAEDVCSEQVNPRKV